MVYMEIIETKLILPHLLLAIPIGFGTTAVCFLKSNNEVLKLFYTNSSTAHLFNEHDMLEHIKFLSTLDCETYSGPNKILLKNDRVIGYYYPYIHMQTLSKIPNHTTIRDITNGYGRLLGDIKKISDVHFKLFDIHHKNILFDNHYKLIDIDKGYQDLQSDKEEIFLYNMRQINRTIVEEIFKLKIDEHVIFEDETIQDYYKKVLFDDPYLMYDFLSKIFKNNDNIKDVQNKVRIKKYKDDDSFYKSI